MIGCTCENNGDYCQFCEGRNEVIDFLPSHKPEPYISGVEALLRCSCGWDESKTGNRGATWAEHITRCAMAI